MKRLYWHLSQRFAEVRASRAFAKYLRLTKKAEKFFHNLESSK